MLKIQELEVGDFIALLSEAIENAFGKQSHLLQSQKEDPPKIKDLLTQKQAAEYLGVSVQTLISWRHKGLLTGHTIGKMVYYYTEEIHSAINEGNFKRRKS